MSDELTFHEKFCAIQQGLKAGKGQYNEFGRYKYRSCEDILEAVKPLLGGLSLTVTDEIILIGDRYYIAATARLDGEPSAKHNTNGIDTTAYAREPKDQKGMNEAQITGSASSYARKYALNGLFCIDDNKDPDATNKHGNDAPNKPTASQATTRVDLSNVNDPFDWALPGGKNKGKKMNDVDAQTLEGLYKWAKDTIADKSTRSAAWLPEFVERFEAGMHS